MFIEPPLILISLFVIRQLTPSIPYESHPSELVTCLFKCDEL